MKTITTLMLSFLILTLSKVNAQDTIYFKNNAIILAKISEVGISEIKYTLFKNLNGPVYTIEKNSVQSITYYNGYKEVITGTNFKPVSKKSSAENINSNDIYISAGSQVGILHLLSGINQLPVHIHLDKKIKNRFFIGLGYSRDSYKVETINGAGLLSDIGLRQNFRIRLYNYFTDEHNNFATYAGGSVGLSKWNDNYSGLLLPSSQLFIGFKTKLTSKVFNQTEISIGSPYLIQTSFGYTF